MRRETTANILKYGIMAIFLVAVGLLFTSVKNNSTPAATKADVTTNREYPAQIMQEMNEQDAVLMDVRTTLEYDTEHAQDAMLFNSEWIDEGQLPDLDKDQKIYLYCRSGNRSAEVTKILEGEGFSNITDIGALSDWKDAGGPTRVTELADYKELLQGENLKPLEVMGLEDAPLTMVKYSDFQCPFCTRYTVETEPEVRRAYVDTGKMKIEYRNLAVQGDASIRAGEALYCANEQGGMWDYHDKLSLDFAQTGNKEVYSMEYLKYVAGGMGFNQMQFDSCMDSGKYNEVVRSETMQSQKEGYTSTPAFKIGQQDVNGALPFTSFKAVIDSQLR
jgi:protein-disulfide isomerase